VPLACKLATFHLCRHCMHAGVHAPKLSDKTVVTCEHAGNEDAALVVPKMLFMTSRELGLARWASRGHLRLLNAVSQWLEGWSALRTITGHNEYIRDSPICIDERAWDEIMADFDSRTSLACFASVFSCTGVYFESSFETPVCLALMFVV
jgi:hypothetical protein